MGGWLEPDGDVRGRGGGPDDRVGDCDRGRGPGCGDRVPAGEWGRGRGGALVRGRRGRGRSRAMSSVGDVFSSVLLADSGGCLDSSTY